MLHTYRKVTFVKAEQFDASDEMIKKYRLHSYGPNTWVFPWDYNFSPIVKNDWIITDEDDLTSVLSPEEFEEEYEEWD